MIDKFGLDALNIQREIDDISHNLKFVRKKSHSRISNLLKDIRSFSQGKPLLNYKSLIKNDISGNYPENNLNNENYLNFKNKETNNDNSVQINYNNFKNENYPINFKYFYNSKTSHVHSKNKNFKNFLKKSFNNAATKNDLSNFRRRSLYQQNLTEENLFLKNFYDKFQNNNKEQFNISGEPVYNINKPKNASAILKNKKIEFSKKYSNNIKSIQSLYEKYSNENNSNTSINEKYLIPHTTKNNMIASKKFYYDKYVLRNNKNSFNQSSRISEKMSTNYESKKSNYIPLSVKKMHNTEYNEDNNNNYNNHNLTANANQHNKTMSNFGSNYKQKDLLLKNDEYNPKRHNSYRRLDFHNNRIDKNDNYGNKNDNNNDSNLSMNKEIFNLLKVNNQKACIDRIYELLLYKDFYYKVKNNYDHDKGRISKKFEINDILVWINKLKKNPYEEYCKKIMNNFNINNLNNFKNFIDNMMNEVKTNNYFVNGMKKILCVNDINNMPNNNCNNIVKNMKKMKGVSNTFKNRTKSEDERRTWNDKNNNKLRSYSYY